jgi:hypothetical protein
LAENYYSPAKCFFHYLTVDRARVRPGADEFSKLVNKTIDDVMLRFSIADLVVRKRNGEELDRAPRVPVISEFVETELARLADNAPGKTDPLPVTELDEFFRNTLLKAA